MDESWLQFLITQFLKDHFSNSEVTEENNTTYDIQIKHGDKTFLVQIMEEEN